MADKGQKDEHKEHKPTKEFLEHDRKATTTAFLLMFPAVILAGIAVYYAPAILSFVSVMLAVYQFIMMKKFITDFYNMR